jgi:hypothetical protein
MEHLREKILALIAGVRVCPSRWPDDHVLRMNTRLLILLCLALVVGVVVYLSAPGESAAPAPSVTSSEAGATAATPPPLDVATASPDQPAGPLSSTPSKVAPDSGGDLLAPVRPADTRTLDGLSGSVVTAAGTHRLSGAEGLFDRIEIGESETISLRVDVPNLKPGEEVAVSASNGGRLERLNGPLRFVPKADSAALELTLTPTTGRGVYNIDIRQDGAVASLRFWAGAPLPVGEPGPSFIPLPPQPDTVP